MAEKRLYTVCALGASNGRINGVLTGFTVARSDEDVERIARMHLPHRSKVYVYMASASDDPPGVAREVAAHLIRYGFDWLDPRPRKERTSRQHVLDLVVKLMA